MLEAPIYPEIEALFSFYGLELDDFAVLLGLFVGVEMVVRDAHAHLGGVDLTLYLSLLATGFLFAMWRVFKRGRPRHFLEDAIALLAEPDVWIGTEDRLVRPSYLIEPTGRVTVAPSDLALTAAPRAS